MLTFAGIRNVEVEPRTGKVSVILAFTHWKKEDPNVEKPKRMSGYLWRTSTSSTDPIYFLQRWLLVQSRYEYGLITKRARPDDDGNYLYPPSIDEGRTTPTKEELLQLPLASFYTVIHAIDDRKMGAPRSAPVWPQAYRRNASNVQVVKRRFAFYPKEILKRFVFHSLRNGFFVHVAITLAKFRQWDILTAMRGACFLGDWAWKTNPAKW
jgi:hypothetical protein